jgi:hypothetical protein
LLIAALTQDTLISPHQSQFRDHFVPVPIISLRDNNIGYIGADKIAEALKINDTVADIQEAMAAPHFLCLEDWKSSLLPNT